MYVFCVAVCGVWYLTLSKAALYFMLLMVIMGSLYSLHISSNFFVSCKSILGTNNVVVVVRYSLNK